MHQTRHRTDGIFLLVALKHADRLCWLREEVDHHNIKFVHSLVTTANTLFYRWGSMVSHS